MSVQPRRAEERSEAASDTLGALLDADPSRARVPEREWVALVRSIAQGDQLALHELYHRAHHIAFTLIMRIVHERETAEELTLDVFHDVWRRASAYDPVDGTVLGWIMNQARSRAIDRHRFEHRKKRLDPHAATPTVASAAADTDAAFEIGDEAARLQAALAVLSAEERQAIETAFFSELTYVEAAERLDQPLGTLKTRIRTGLRKLRAALRAEDGEP